MSFPSLDELAVATKTTVPEKKVPEKKALAPSGGDMFEQELARRQEEKTRLRKVGARRDAIKLTLKHFPDATPEEAVPIAKEFESKLFMKSDPDYLDQQEFIRRKNALDEGVERGAEVMGQGFPLIGGVAGSLVAGPPGAVVGAMAGGAVQSLHNLVMGKNVTPMSALRNMRNQGTYEALGFGAFDMSAGVISRFFRGDKAIADSIIAAHAQLGMRPALQDISNRFWTEGARTVLGALPFANRPFKRRAAQAGEEFTRKLDEFIETSSPEIAQAKRLYERDPRAAAALMEQLSNRAFQHLNIGVDALQRERDLAYEVLRRTVEQAEARAFDSGWRLAAPSVNSRVAIGEIAQRFGERTVTRIDGSQVPMTENLQSTADFIRDITQNVLARDMTFTQYRALKGRIRDQIELVKDDATASEMLRLFQDGVEQDMEAVARMTPSVWSAYQNAQSVSEEFLTLLQGTVSRRMKGVQKTFGRQGPQMVRAETGELVLKDSGPKDLSNTIDILSRSASPNEIRQFRGALARGVGEPQAQETMRVVLGKKVQEAIDAAFKQGAERSADAAYVPGVLLQKLGLDTPYSPQFKTTMALFEASGIPANQVFAISTVLDSLYSVKNPRVAQMLARQTTLGGVKTLIRSLTAGAIGGAAQTGLAGFGWAHAAGLWFLSRSYGKWVTSPARARAVVAMADAHLPQHSRVAAAVSVFTDPVFWTDPEDPVKNEMLKETQKAVLQELRTKEGQKRFLNSTDNYLKGVVE